MPKYKIEYDANTCIGSLACSHISTKLFKATEDEKGIALVNGVYNKDTKKWEVVIDESELDINKEAEEACPVRAIKVTKIE